jgi:hypothetical protein
MAQFEGRQSSHSIFSFESFESPRARAGIVEITGTEATIALPDSNRFDGDVRLWRAGDKDWTVIPATGPANGRGIGVLDMARAIRAGVPHRATGALAYHVLDAMVSIAESWKPELLSTSKAPPQGPRRSPRTGTPPLPNSRNGSTITAPQTRSPEEEVESWEGIWLSPIRPWVETS